MTFLLSIFALSAFAQEAVKNPRPKIGIALAGGSALGLAHVGVFDWLEKHHIPVDYVAGTSMGGLVGGGYATGRTPAELLALLKSIDWDDALRGGPAFELQSFRRKEDLREVPTRLGFGLRGGIKLPSGLNPANPINLMLSRVCLPYSEITNFDSLPIPFRCIATDMTKGEAVALKDGQLVTALRATMAIPGVFTPVSRDNTLYTDGGTLNNIPTEAVKDMGADIIIAVDLSSGFLNGKTSQSFLDIVGRTINVATYANERRSLKLADIILSPELGKLSITDFSKVDEFAQKGYDAAEAKTKILQQFALNDADWNEYLAKRKSRILVEFTDPHFIDTIADDPRKAAELNRRLRPQVEFALDKIRLEKELTAITGEGRYESFSYSGETRNGTHGLSIRANEKRYGPPFLNFGLAVNGADSNNIRTDLFARFSSLDVGRPGAEIRADIKLGSDKQISAEYYFPFSRNHWFLAPHAGYFDTNRNFYNQGARQAVYGEVNVGGGADIGVLTSRKSELRFGYQYDYERATIRTGGPFLPSLSGAASYATMSFTYDGQDSPIIPSKGTRLSAKAKWYFRAPGSVKEFPTVDIQYFHFYPARIKGDSTFTIVGVGTAFGSQPPPLQQFAFGGPFLLGAYNQDALRGNDYLRASFGYLHRLATLPSFIGGKVMLGGWYEFGGAFERFDHARYLQDLSIGLLAETSLGPVIVGYSYGEHGSAKLYFTIGRLF